MMKRSVKAVALLLAMVLCVGIVEISAAGQQPFVCEMVLTPYNSLDNLMISVTTDQAAGAVTGKLTFDSNLVSFDPQNTLCHETGVDAAELYTVEGNTITFVIVADDLTNGQTQWIDFAFVAKATGVAAFSVTDARASDVNENLSEAITVASVSKQVDLGPLKTLGASYRPASEAATGAALRFGTKLYRDKETAKVMVDNEEKLAVYCGYILGFADNIKAKNGIDQVPELEVADFNTADGKFTKVIDGAIIVHAQKALVIEEEYLVYTVAITGISDDTRATVGGVENVLVMDAPLVARPYVVYQNGDNTYGICYGAQINKTFREVEELYTRVEG